MANERSIAGRIGLEGYAPLLDANWNVWMDENLFRLSVKTSGTVQDIVTALPGSPTEGDIVLLDASAGSNPNEIAAYDDGAWRYLAPWEGFQLWVEDENKFIYYDGSAWVDLIPTSIGDFLGLPDTPSSYSGFGGFNLRVTSGEDGVEFVDNVTGLSVQDEGGNIGTGGDVQLINFVGAGVVATAGGAIITVTIPGGGGGSAVSIEDDGNELSAAPTKLNFVGFDMTEPVTDEITITLPDASGQPAFLLALSDETTALVATTDVSTFRAPYALEILDVKASLNDASTSGAVEIDIKVNGTSILSTNLTIDQGQTTSVGAAVAAVISNAAVADDDEVSFDIVTAGTGATGLKVSLVTRSSGGVVAEGAARGVRLSITSDQTLDPFVEETVVWAVEDFDDANMADLVANNTRITVPAGVTRISLVAGAAFNNNGTDCFLSIRKNGDTDSIAQMRADQGGSGRIMCATGILDVTAGDYFEAVVQQAGGADLSAVNATFFSAKIEELGGGGSAGGPAIYPAFTTPLASEYTLEASSNAAAFTNTLTDVLDPVCLEVKSVGNLSGNFNMVRASLDAITGAEATWRYEVGFVYNYAAQGNGAGGLYMKDSTETNLYQLRILPEAFGDFRFSRLASEGDSFSTNSPTGAQVNRTDLIQYQRGLCYMAIEYDGTDYYAQHSYDGRNWLTFAILNEAGSDLVNPIDSVGFFINTANNGGANPSPQATDEPAISAFTHSFTST